MVFVDKASVLSRIQTMDQVILELGCGQRKRNSTAIGVDILDYDCVDIVGDIFEVLEKIPDHSVDSIYSYHFFEHIDNLELLIYHIERVLKVAGTLDVVVPHFSNPYFYSDYSHRSFFGLYTFCYLASSSLFKRQVPSYQRKIRCKLISVDLVFKAPRPFYVQFLVKKILERIVNISNYTKELYEGNFCYIFPCYEINYKLEKIH